MHPWKDISLSDYENHMSLDSVYQLQTLNSMMKAQIYDHNVSTIVILGIAGGNGLEHIRTEDFERVYGVDINECYLEACHERYPELEPVLSTICADLSSEEIKLPHAELIIADLLIEYIGYECFINAVNAAEPKYVSCIIQINTDESFVSDSPYLNAFDRLNEVHHSVDEQGLTEAMALLGYSAEIRVENDLPNGKKLLRLDYIR